MTNQELLQLIEEAARDELSSLNLRFNKLSSLPPEITQLTCLTSLNLSYNHLNSLPSEIGQLTSLTSLDLGDNHLNSLPSDCHRKLASSPTSLRLI